MSHTPTALTRTNGRDLTLDQPLPLPPGTAQTAAAANPDWDLLFNAVTTRLRDIADAVATLPGLAGMPQQARSRVLECADALDQLHASMAQQQVLQQTLQNSLLSEQHDRLTALPNRHGFSDVLDRALLKTDTQNKTDAQKPRLALLVLALDGFKPINAQHGHLVGDHMLRIVATRLARAVRAGDCVGRTGGDDFACLLGGIQDRQQLSHLACKLFDAVSAPLKIGRLQLTVRPSIGIAICPTDGATADVLLRRADAAMGRAKRAQSGYAFFERGAEHGAESGADLAG